MDAPAQAAPKLTSLPLRFEANHGQTDPEVRFVVRQGHNALFLTDDEAVFTIGADPGGSNAGSAVRMSLAGGSANSQIAGVGRLPGTTNYLLGDDRSLWQTGIPGYSAVKYRSVYSGVDVVYHTRRQVIEYDFVVRPGADPTQIKMAFEGQQRISLGDDGDLLLHTAAGTVRHHRPVVFQEVAGSRRPVSGSFVLDGQKRVGFRLGDYDRRHALVIDPEVEYATFLGGSGINPNTTTPGDRLHDIAVDSSGSAYVAGEAWGADFPTKGALQSTLSSRPDAVVAKLAPDGRSLVYSTYLGGSLYDRAFGIAVDGAGQAYVTGATTSRTSALSPGSAFPTQGAYQSSRKGGQDAFLAKLAPNGASLLYSTYLGGSEDENDFDGLGFGAGGVAVDSTGIAVLAGHTASQSDFPTKQPYQSAKGWVDAFVAGIDTTKGGAESLVWSTFLGGAGADRAVDVALTSGGEPVVTGQTCSQDFETTEDAIEPQYKGECDAFVTKFRPDGQALVYSTFLGGSGEDASLPNEGSPNGDGYGHEADLFGGVAVDGNGAAYVTGGTCSDDFPRENALRETHGGACDAFVAKLSSNGGSLGFSTYLGGTGNDQGHAISVDAAGRVHIAGSTRSEDFPTVKPVAPRATGRDAFLAVLDPSGRPLVSSSYLGGTGSDSATALAVDDAGASYVAGSTGSYDFPSHNAVQGENRRGPVYGRNGFVAKIAIGAAATPLVTRVEPATGPLVGGTPVVITGSGLSGASSVSFGDTPAAAVTVEPDGRLVAVTPPRAPGSVAVTVTTASGTSPPNPITRFTYGEGSWKPVAEAPPVPFSASHAAVTLADGRVLVVGGRDSEGNSVKTAQLFDPLAGEWAGTGDLNRARSGHTATLLKDGRVLVVGGRSENVLAAEIGSSAEVYDPKGESGGSWSLVHSTKVAGRTYHTATRLNDGRVLVAGGGFEAGRTAEIYHPGEGWTRSGPMVEDRTLHRAVLLPSGRVLVVGGDPGGESAEVYAPDLGTWLPAGPLREGRDAFTASLLGDGRALVVGGTLSEGENHPPLRTAEVFEPAAEHGVGGFSPASLLDEPRMAHAAVELPNGRLLVLGGRPDLLGDNAPVATGHVYDPSGSEGRGAWRGAGLMSARRHSGNSQDGLVSATLLLPSDPSALTDINRCHGACGAVLVVGGDAGATAELYIPAPSITGVAPGAGVAGSTVAITGTGFTHGLRSVSFGGIPARSIHVNGYGLLTATVPPEVPPGPAAVTVTTDAGEATANLDVLLPPGRVDDLVAEAVSPTAVELSFAAPAVPGSSTHPQPAASRYVVKQSTAPIDDEDSFAAAPALCEGGVCSFSPAPSVPGDRVILSVDPLAPGTEYHFRLRALGDAGELGPLSNPAVATTPGGVGTDAGCAGPRATGAREHAVSTGYSLVAGPEGTVTGADGPLYTWQNQGAGSVYERLDPSAPLVGGRGYWAWFACPDVVSLSGPGASSASVPLAARHASMVGNPSGELPATVSGHDFAARWDRALNDGAGGYHVSGYQELQRLAVMEGAWVFAYRAATISIGS